MNSISLENRIKIIKIHYENGGSVKVTFRKIRDIFGQHNRPSETAIKNLVAKFESTGSVQNVPTPTRVRPGRSTENIAAVCHSVEEDPNLSIPQRSQQLGLSKTTTWRILHKDLALKHYKVQLVQELKLTDHLHRRRSAQFIQEQPAGFSESIIFSDEAHFHLSGYVNKQNCRIWASENPKEIIEKPLHAQRFTVWCAMWSGGVIWPFFFEDEAGNAVTVNGSRYREMLTFQFWPIIDDINITNMWFQQDGATCHTANETINLLQTKFPDRIISRNSAVKWPARSCDLTPLDYFLWGYVKDRVYTEPIESIAALKLKICDVINEIYPPFCQKVIKNFVERIDICQRGRGGHLPDIIFHS
ncbi:unnamed protein product [Parnassius mnemosyne]|uniref:DUF4817 domain-containing protein n=1 Tax=Parnassius mnemosyne TaxID=213953 RepID=A0AAV1L051_9NEOP